MRAGEAVIETEGQLQAAAHAGAVDGGDSGERQLLKRGDEVMAALDELARQCRVRLGTAEFLQVGAGDEHAGFTAPEDKALQVVAGRELRYRSFEFADHGLAERVGPAAGLVEGEHGDL